MRSHQNTSDTLKAVLLSSPVLVLPELLKPFQLHVHERQELAPEVLIQTLTPVT